LSIQTPLGPRHHHALGQALQPLRDEGVLILGSGNMISYQVELRWNARSCTDSGGGTSSQ
jgi:4,5-DOPA dioxygenase extradiol